jgi:Uncharacterised protein family (UPF0158)
VVAVSLKDIVDAMDVIGDDTCSYLNPKTGEIVTLTGDERRLAEDEDLDEEYLPKWQADALPKIREVMESDEFLALPDKFEIHDWEIMERFTRSLINLKHGEELSRAIHGGGAFRKFKIVIRRLGIEEKWFRFRESALEEIAKDWLEEHGIPVKSN